MPNKTLDLPCPIPQFALTCFWWAALSAQRSLHNRVLHFPPPLLGKLLAKPSLPEICGT